MKKYILNNLKFVAVGVVLAISISYAFANEQGSAPFPFSAPLNTSTPLNVSDLDQVKPGDLDVSAFISREDAELQKTVTFLGTVYGGTPLGYSTDGKTNASLVDCTGASDGNGGPSTLCFGGTDAKGVARGVNIAATGSLLQDNGQLTFANLANTTDSHVCSDAAGNVVLCTDDGDVCPNIDGFQDHVPEFYIKNSVGDCVPDDLCKNIAGDQFTMPVGYIRDTQGNCSLSNDIVAYMRVARSCQADTITGEHGLSFIDGEGGTLPPTGTGTYDLAIDFSQALPAATTLKLKVCTSHPASYNTLFGNKSWYGGSASCVDGIGVNDQGGAYVKTDSNGNGSEQYDGAALTLDDLTALLSNKKVVPRMITLAKNTTTVTIRDISCLRAGYGSKLKWSQVGSVDTQFSQATPDNSITENIVLNTGVMPRPTHP